MDTEQQKASWRDKLHIPSREGQHRLYGGELSEKDFDTVSGYNLFEWALKTEADMCAAIPELEGRWCGLELDWLIYEYNKEEDNEQNCRE